MVLFFLLLPLLLLECVFFDLVLVEFENLAFPLDLWMWQMKFF